MSARHVGACRVSDILMLMQQVIRCMCRQCMRDVDTAHGMYTLSALFCLWRLLSCCTTRDVSCGVSSLVAREHESTLQDSTLCFTPASSALAPSSSGAGDRAVDALAPVGAGGTAPTPAAAAARHPRMSMHV